MNETYFDILFRWYYRNASSDHKPTSSGDEKKRLRAARKRQRQARK